MKKLTLTIAALLTVCFSTFAQETPKEGGDLAFKENDNIISVGYGFPNLGTNFLNIIDQSNNNSWSAGGFGPFTIKYERAIAPSVGIGVVYNYADAFGKWTDSSYDYKVGRKTNSLLFRLNVHFATTEKMDAYFGIGAGFRNAVYYSKTTDPNFTDDSYNFGTFFPVGFETTLGLRYYVSKNIGIYTELGLAKALIQAGIAVKL